MPSTDLREIYGLTPREDQVAVRVLQDHGLQAVADKLHVTLSTVCIHLQRVFEKTETHRQAERIRLLVDLDTSRLAARPSGQLGAHR